MDTIGMCHRGTEGLAVLRASPALRDCDGMKHIWTVRGTYFDWEMTVTVRPAEKPPIPITQMAQGSAIARMKQVGRHFHEAANLHEYSLEFELLRAGVDRSEPLQFVPGEVAAGQSCCD